MTRRYLGYYIDMLQTNDVYYIKRLLFYRLRYQLRYVPIADTYPLVQNNWPARTTTP